MLASEKYAATMLDDLRPSYNEVLDKREECRKLEELVDALKDAVECCNAIGRITDSDAMTELVGNPALKLLREAEHQLEQARQEAAAIEDAYEWDIDE